VRSQAAALGAVLAVTAAALTQLPANGARVLTPHQGAAASVETTHTLRVGRGPDGSVRTFSVPRDARDPAVDRSADPRAAARLQLARYDAVLGGGDTSWSGATVSRTVTGDDVVRLRQRRDGLLVIGGAVAVDLRPDRQLASVTASVSRASVPAATYPRGAAVREALAVATKHLGPDATHRLTADPLRRRLFDPAVFGVPRSRDPMTRARGVWWVQVHAGPTFERLVLVDDRTGAVVLDLDLVEQIDRVVCDNDNDMTQLDLPCTHDFARTEHGPASRVKDVNDAFDLAGAVSVFYRTIGHLDLTRLLGVDEGDHRSLSSTVRYCDPFAPPAFCPLANAFWNGVGMFYGEGFASADDVVGHEMTHGVISHNADLFYWGQSGAINESLADVMGEIVDHRHRSPGDSAHSWTIGEDLPIGALRSMREPGRFGQPGTMTSRRYARGQDDNGGVHTNSGVGNRAFYLISQGGRQAGRTVHGIDGRSLRKSATLYLDVIQHLVSGSDYADLGAVLDRSCRDLARHHTVGMTRDDCRNVHRATLATRMRTTPPRATQPADASMTCPRGAGPVRLLFDSERGHPAGKVVAGPTWVRAPDQTVFPPVAANATSGHTSWFSSEPQDTTVSSLTVQPVALPSSRPAYLWFQQWRLLEAGTRFDGTPVNYDAGTVEVADATRGAPEGPAEGLPWVNGPRDVITDMFGNPSAGRVGFSRDSHGYLASRVGLSRYAGHAVSPQFTMNTDNDSTAVGWYLDDVRVYTCGRAPVPRSTPQITGDAIVGAQLTASPGSWSPSDATLAIEWWADGHRIAGATGPSYVVQPADLGKRISVRVSAFGLGRHASTFSAATAPVTSG
jgi:Zn-dependent metalloprotease